MAGNVHLCRYMMGAAKIWCSVCGLAAALGACEQRVDVEPTKKVTEGASDSAEARTPLQTPAELVVQKIITGPDEIVGRRVQFETAQAQHVGRAAMVVGPTASMNEAVLVIPLDPRMVSGIEAGERVQVRGVVKKMPPPQWATGMPGADPAIEKAQQANVTIYVEAEMLQAPAEPLG